LERSGRVDDRFRAAEDPLRADDMKEHRDVKTKQQQKKKTKADI